MVRSCKEAWEALRRADGILVPGGFGNRGVNGKVAAIHYARTTGKPFLGVCLGLQCAVIEYARSVLGWEGANSAEFDAEAPYRMVVREAPCRMVVRGRAVAHTERHGLVRAGTQVQMSEIDPTVMGGTMRLGSKPTLLCGVRDADSGEVKQSLAHLVYSGQASAWAATCMQHVACAGACHHSSHLCRPRVPRPLPSSCSSPQVLPSATATATK